MKRLAPLCWSLALLLRNAHGFSQPLAHSSHFRSQRRQQRAPNEDVTPMSVPRGAYGGNIVHHAGAVSPIHLSGQDAIEAAVSFDTFAPQFLWLLIIGFPESPVTQKVMKLITPILGLALVHLVIVALAAVQEGALSQILIFGEVFDPSTSQLAGMQKLFAYPNFVAEEWPHVLIWDLFVGRAIWMDGLERGIDTRLALAFCNFIGPPGLLIYAATCLITKKGLPKF